MSDEMVKYWRARPRHGGPWLYDESLPALAETIADGAMPGGGYEIECVELTLHEVDSLGDFPGW